MVQRMQIILEDDVDGTKADETVTFGLDGVNYEIDLSEENAQQLRDTISPWVEKARRTGGRKATGRKSKTGTATDIRAWARANGMQISSRGRVPADIVAAYQRANS